MEKLMENTMESTIDWKCPQCGATATKHGKGGKDECLSGNSTSCSGFLCECDCDDIGEYHGQVESDICEEARCYHCEWVGRMPPKKSNSSKLKGWQKKAWEAGWRPTDS